MFDTFDDNGESGDNKVGGDNTSREDAKETASEKYEGFRERGS